MTNLKPSCTSVDACVTAWAERIRAQMNKTLEDILELGTLLIECKTSLPDGQYLATLDLVGLDHRVAQMYARIARNPVLTNAKTFSHLPPHYSKLNLLAHLDDADLQQAVDEGRVWPSMKVKDVKALVETTRVSRSQTKTPAAVVADEKLLPQARLRKAAHQVMGGIDLDPIVSGTIDALKESWTGRVWLNPPSEPPTLYTRKVIKHYKNREVKTAVVLTPNDTDTDWWQDLAFESSAACFVLTDVMPGGCVCYLGRSVMKFASAFNQFGLVVPMPWAGKRTS